MWNNVGGLCVAALNSFSLFVGLLIDLSLISEDAMLQVRVIEVIDVFWKKQMDGFMGRFSI